MGKSVDRDLIGFKNNLLTAVSKIRKNNRWYWNCSCECGSSTTIREDWLLAGKTKSCGCFGSIKSIYRINQKEPGESALHSHFSVYKKSAKEREIEFLLTKKEFLDITSLNCHYCNMEPRYLCFNKTAHGEANANGIDRVNNDIGYTILNSVPCCKDCNTAKGVMSYEAFVDFIKRIHNHMTNKGLINE